MDAGARASVDLRYQWVQAVLAQSPDAPAGVVLEEPDILRAVVRRAAVLQSVSGRRVLYIDVHSSQTVTATIAITREDRMLAHKSVTGVRGSRRIRIDIPSQTQPGTGAPAAQAPQRIRELEGRHARDPDPARAAALPSALGCLRSAAGRRSPVRQAVASGANARITASTVRLAKARLSGWPVSRSR